MSDVGSAAPTPAQELAFARAPLPPPARSRRPTLHVAGGPDSVSAEVEALDAAAGVLHRVVGVLEAAAREVVAAAGRDVDGSDLGDLLLAATGPGRTGLAGCGEELSGTARHLRRAAEGYRGTDGKVASEFDGSVLDRLVHDVRRRVHRAEGRWVLRQVEPFLLHEVAARGDSGALESGTQGPASPWASLAGSRHVEGAVAGLGVLLAGGAGGRAAAVRRLDRQVVANAREAHLMGGDRAVVEAAPTDAAATPASPARSTRDLVLRLEAIGPDAAGPARILVQRTVRPDGSRVATVYVPGTQDWRTGAENPMDAQSDLEEAAGERSAATDAVTQALERAGVGPDEPLMLVGHSQGGMTATALAADPSFRRRFDPTAVVTAGSPIAADRVPAGVHVLALEHTDDVVPHLDGAPNAAAPGITTVTSATPRVRGPVVGSQLGPHDTATYVATAGQVDASRDPRLAAARAPLQPFLGSAGTTTTTLWRATRRHPLAPAPGGGR